jgi:hypothetical protein
MSKQHKSLQKFTDALTWASRASSERKYVAPETRWQKFLYLMSYGEGTIVKVERKVQSPVAVSEETVSYTPQASVNIPIHAIVMTTSSGTTLMTKGSVLR